MFWQEEHRDGDCDADEHCGNQCCTDPHRHGERHEQHSCGHCELTCSKLSFGLSSPEAFQTCAELLVQAERGREAAADFGGHRCRGQAGTQWSAMRSQGPFEVSCERHSSEPAHLGQDEHRAGTECCRAACRDCVHSLKTRRRCGTAVIRPAQPRTSSPPQPRDSGRQAVARSCPAMPRVPDRCRDRSRP